MPWLTVVAGAVVLSACTAAATPTPSATPNPAATAAMSSVQPSGVTGTRPDAAFPSTVAGLPVLSVADAAELLASGGLDGQAVAVAGYYDMMALPCPYPGRYIGPLESWCRSVAFTDTRAGAQLCQPNGANGMTCSEPSGVNLAPWFMTETSGSASSFLPGGATGEPAALVLIGHAGDARQWQCTAATQAACASAFVVDRVAWANGNTVGPAAPETGDSQTGKVITPRMTLAQVAAAAGLGDDLLTGAPLRKGDVAAVDPRWTVAGDDIVWLVRSLGPAATSGPARPETVWLVDDATGRVIDSHPLRLAADYRPARLWQMATIHGMDCCTGDVGAFYRVTSSDGSVASEGMVPGDSSSGADTTIQGGGYLSTPLVLPAGSYTVDAWLAPYDGGVMGTPRDECSTRVTLAPLGDRTLNADYPSTRACTFGPAPSASPGS